jgi:adenylate kinase family enzyme
VRRIAILGGAGAGKSTLARRLGAQLALPVLHLDRLVFDPGWKRADAAVVRGRLLATLPADGWIVDGSYVETGALTLPEADLVIWLDRATPLRLLRAWRKTRGGDRPDRPEGCPERFGARYLRDILGLGRFTPALEAAVRRAATRARVVCLRSDRQVEALVASLAPDEVARAA